MAETVYFVTNRPPCQGGFGPPPPCGPTEKLSFGSASVDPSRDPARAGRLHQPVTIQGADPCAVAEPDADLVGFLRMALLSAEKAGRTPIVVVHGYSYSFPDAVVRSADLAAWLGDGDFPVDLAPILFTWPSVDALSAAGYLADRGRAEASASALARFILAFALAWKACGRPRALYLAHSMGTWVSQNGMRALVAGGHDLPDDLFEQAVIMGGDADTNGLEPGQGLDELARLSEWLSVAVNRTDFATDVTSTKILGRPRLGSSGPADVRRIPRNCRIIDYTLAIAADRAPTPPGETDWNYKLHQYYRTVPAVRDDLGAILSGGHPDEIEGRFSSDQMIQAGQPYIQPGRLYVCAASAPAPGFEIAGNDLAERRG